jgi:acyl-CoA reductase-like NAD-dependent aldehyde dehydrogenase
MDSTDTDNRSYTVPFFINGEESHPEKQFDVVSPATGKLVHKCGSASPEHVTAAVDAAATAFKSWRKVTPARRRDIFLKAAEIMGNRREELAQYMISETSGARPWVDLNLNIAIDFIKDVAGRIATIEGMVPATSDDALGAMVLKEPYGVVLAIAPWYGIRTVIGLTS